LFDLVNQGHIDFAEALRMSTNPDDFQLRFSGVSAGKDQWGGGDSSVNTGGATFELELDGHSDERGGYGKASSDDD
jgi:hypothetical protein